MDETRHAFGNDRPWRGQHARTFKHYIVSPDPEDNISLSDLRRLAKAWAKEHFGDYEVAIVYHDDNVNGIPHAHLVINNTNLETGHRLQEPSSKQNNDSLQRLTKDMGLAGFEPTRPTHGKASASNPATWQGKHVRRAEAELEGKGRYSWVADIRCRMELAKAVAKDKSEYVAILNAMGIEDSDNSPKADRRDFIYSFSDHPTWKIRGERLGLDYGRYSVERGFTVHALDRASERRTVSIARKAVDVGDMGELRQLSSFVAICERYAARSVADLEETMRRASSAEDKAAIGHAIEYARSHEITPTETPHAKPRKTQSAPKPWEKHPWQERGSHAGESQRQQMAQQQAQRHRRERNEHDR